MVIVPKNVALEVEAMIENKDKGSVIQGQTVWIKVAAFPFTRHGTIEGRIEDVSNDAIAVGEQGIDGALMFLVRVSLSREYMMVKDEKRILTPGMMVTVEVRTGELRVIDYLLTPLLRYKDEAMRER